MMQAVALALAVAATNVAVSQWANRRGAPNGEFWRAQGLKFLFRVCTIFGGATWVWTARRRMPEVVAFIFTGAVAQMVGQIYFFMERTDRARSGRES